MLLAIDTATHTIGLALHDGRRVVAESAWLTANHHTVELAPSIATMLNHVGLTPGDLRGVAVALGPGSFTGLRIGLGVAKGMVLADDTLALVGVPTLDVLAAAQWPPGRDERLCAVLRAGRGRLAAGLYHWEAGSWQAEGKPFVATWEALLDKLAEKPTRIAGEFDGDAAPPAAGHLTLVRGAASLRRAGYLAELGWQRLESGQRDDPATLAPLYLHQPEATAP